MKRLLIAALVAAQVATAAAPAQAADLGADAAERHARTGAFAGGRLRVALGGERRERVRAGLTLAPALHRTESGVARIQIGEGLEYGATGRRAASLSFAGRALSDLGRSPNGPRRNVSTAGWVAIGVGTVLLVGVGVLGWLVHEADQNTE